MRKMILIFLMFYAVSLTDAENLIINTKNIYINEISLWPSLNEYLNSYKRFKNYRITENKAKNDLMLAVRIKKLTFTVTNFDNDMGSVAINDGGVVLQKKNEQTVKFIYDVELILATEKNPVLKKINFSDSYNVWFSFKKISSDESNQMQEYSLYESKSGVKDMPNDINMSFNNYGLVQYKEQLLMDISKKIANRLSVEL